MIPVRPSFITGHSRVTMLAPAFIMRTTLGHGELNMRFLGPTVKSVSVDMDYNGRPFAYIYQVWNFP